jgi:micrococcal nuclease
MKKFILLFLILLQIFCQIQVYAKDNVTLVKVIDGDTIVVNLNNKEEHVRLIGVDTFESKYNKRIYIQVNKYNITKEVALQLGLNAKENTVQITSHNLVLDYDKQDRDNYGRLLAYVYLENNKMLNEEILKSGNGVTAFYRPNVKYKKQFKILENEAKKNKIGIWKIIK